MVTSERTVWLVSRIEKKPWHKCILSRWDYFKGNETGLDE